MQRPSRVALVTIVFGLALALASAPAHAEQGVYPDKPIRMIIPFAPGGGIDTVGRILAQKLSSGFGQTVVVDNRAGAGGMIGIETALKAAPDGYTMLFISGGYAANAAIYKLQYDPIADVTPIAFTGESGYVIAVHPSVAAKNTQELIALAKTRPGALNYGTSGVGGLTHLATELFERMAGIQMTHIKYKGSAPAVIDLLAGQIQVSFAAVPTVAQYLAANRLRAIAVTTSGRIAAIPDVPAIAETVPGYETTLWYGVLGPKGLRKDVVARWSREVAAALKDPEVRDRLASEGFSVGDSSAARVSEVLKRDVVKWRKLVKEANIKVLD